MQSSNNVLPQWIDLAHRNYILLPTCPLCFSTNCSKIRADPQNQTAKTNIIKSFITPESLESAETKYQARLKRILEGKFHDTADTAVLTQDTPDSEKKKKGIYRILLHPLSSSSESHMECRNIVEAE